MREVATAAILQKATRTSRAKAAGFRGKIERTKIQRCTALPFRRDHPEAVQSGLPLDQLSQYQTGVVGNFWPEVIPEDVDHMVALRPECMICGESKRCARRSITLNIAQNVFTPYGHQNMKSPRRLPRTKLPKYGPSVHQEAMAAHDQTFRQHDVSPETMGLLLLVWILTKVY